MSVPPRQIDKSGVQEVCAADIHGLDAWVIEPLMVDEHFLSAEGQIHVSAIDVAEDGLIGGIANDLLALTCLESADEL